jgi:hypothetical protein
MAFLSMGTFIEDLNALHRHFFSPGRRGRGETQLAGAEAHDTAVSADLDIHLVLDNTPPTRRRRSKRGLPNGLAIARSAAVFTAA